MATAAFVLIAYLIGSLSFAVIVSRAFALPDPRSYGSGQIRRDQTCCAPAGNSRRFSRSSVTAEKAGLAVFLALRYAAEYGRGRDGSRGLARSRCFWVISFRCSSASRAARAYPRGADPACNQSLAGSRDDCDLDRYRALLSVFVACGHRLRRICTAYYFFLFGAREVLPALIFMSALLLLAPQDEHFSSSSRARNTALAKSAIRRASEGLIRTGEQGFPVTPSI